MTDKLQALIKNVGATDAFPMMSDFSTMYSEKGIRTVFFSIGSSKSPLADLEISEAIGCPVNVFPLRESDAENWRAVSACLKDRTASTNPFLEGVDKVWVLPKNIRIRESLPWWENGTMVVDGEERKTGAVETVVSQVCADLKVKDAAQRIDILKVDVGNYRECGFIGAVLNSGFRPGILMVNWTETPNSNTSITIAAGHLQNCGYVLLGKEGNKYLYYYVDDDLYISCDWEKTVMVNPIVSEVVRAYRENMSKLDKTKSLGAK
jgi:hypothetical protein